MSNGANRIFNVIKSTGEGSTKPSSQLVYLTVKSLNPLNFSLGDKLIITEDFYILSDFIDRSKLSLNDILLATTFNDGQKYFIQEGVQTSKDIRISDDKIIISAFEPEEDNRKELWVEAGKNLLSVNDVTGSQFLFSNLPIYLTPGTYTFTYRTTANVGETELSLLNNNDRIMAVNLTNRNDEKISRTFTLNQNVNQIFLYANGEGRYYDMQIAIGNDDEFEPYNPNKSIKANINGAYETIINKNIYSQNEVIIGEWFGRTLYRKVIDFGNLPNATTKHINIGINGVNIVDIRGFMATTTGTFATLPFVGLASDAVAVYVDGSVLYVRTQSNRSNLIAKFIIEYIK